MCFPFVCAVIRLLPVFTGDLCAHFPFACHSPGYGWKLKKVLQAVTAVQHDYDYVLFTDSFDSYIFCDPEHLVETFKTFQHPMVVSGEVNIWPNPELADQMPPSSASGHYKYPNSGGYMAEIPYLLALYDKMAINWKSDCVDDQGELIKAIALDHSAFKIDHQAVLFQTLYGSYYCHDCHDCYYCCRCRCRCCC